MEDVLLNWFDIILIGLYIIFIPIVLGGFLYMLYILYQDIRTGYWKEWKNETYL